jgi:hypothetical protein
MALVVKDRVQETSTTTGTGTFTLAGAVSGFQSFSVIGNANTTYYAIVGGTEWEVGLGTYTSSGTALSRDTILESSNGGTAVNFSAGTKNVFVTYPAEKGIYLDASGNAIALGTPVSVTLTNATGLPISTGVSGLGTNVATFLATPTSANLAAALTDETGTGANVFATLPTFGATGVKFSGSTSGTTTVLSGAIAGTSVLTLPVATDTLVGKTTTDTLTNKTLTSPTLTTPVLGTPSSGTLTSCTGLPLTTGVTGTLPVANGGTGITSLGAGVATFLGTPSSANLASAVTDETGSGSLVFATSPTLVTPALGTPSSGTLTNCTFPTLNQNTTGSAATVTGNATGSTFGFNSGYGSVVTAYGCRAWVNFNGTGTVAIRSSGNVTSITDNGTGDYTVNFTTSITDVNYAVTGMSRSTSSSGYLIYGHATSGNATGSVRISTSSTTAFGDSETISISIFR